MDKNIEEMSILELKGVLFNCTQQIQEIQAYANTKIVPLIEKKVKEEGTKDDNEKPIN